MLLLLAITSIVTFASFAIDIVEHITAGFAAHICSIHQLSELLCCVCVVQVTA